MTDIPPAVSGDPDESNFVRAARTEVNKLIKANRVNMWYRWLSVALIIILIYAVIDLRQQNISACQAGNSFRAGNEAIWHKLFAISYGASKPSAEELRLDNEFLAYVVQVDGQHACGWTVYP